MLKKRYIKSRNVSKVTFELLKTEMPEGVDVKSVNLVGDFNAWKQTAMPMKRATGGAYRLTVELEPGKAYQFRYLVNGEHWCNDWHADAYVSAGLDVDNCVVLTPEKPAS
jgi:1,4-alpha-glucan branching enzyme